MKAWAPPRGKVLVLAPHPDDETIGCGGAIAFHRRRGDPVLVVFATDGERGDPQGRFRGRDLAAVRRREALAAAKTLGVFRTEFWGFPDGGLAAEEKLGARVAALLRRERPAVVYRPGLRDPHGDHRALARACRKAAAARPRPPLESAYEIYDGGRPDSALDVSLEFSVKLRALSRHRSQLASTDWLGRVRRRAAARGLALGRARFAEGYFVGPVATAAVEAGVLYRRASTRSRAALQRLRSGQKEAFRGLAGEFSERVRETSGPGGRKFLLPHWENTLAAVSRALRPRPSFHFLRKPALRAMLREDAPVAERDLRAGPIARRADLRTEDAVGGHPRLLPGRHSSTTQLQHLKDLSRFLLATGCRLPEIGVSVEWGGGYGGLAKCLRRLRPALTQIVIDAPIMSCLQWLYLSTIFGAGAVHQIRAASGRVEPGKINLLPLTFTEGLAGLKGDFFISTFALSESAPAALDFVLARRWFGARRLLVGYDDRLADSKPLAAALARKRARFELEPGGGAGYAFL